MGAGEGQKEQGRRVGSGDAEGIDSLLARVGQSSDVYLKKLGELLIEEGCITYEDIVKALTKEDKHKIPLGKALLALNHRKREELARFLASGFKVPRISIKNYKIPADVIHLIPVSVARKHEVVPLEKFGDIICVAKANYYNRAAVAEIRRITGLKVKVLQCSSEEILEALKRYYGSSKDVAVPETVVVPGAIPQEVVHGVIAADPQPERVKEAPVVGILEQVFTAPLEPEPIGVAGVAPAPAVTGQLRKADEVAPVIRRGGDIRIPPAVSTGAPIKAIPITPEEYKIAVRACREDLVAEWEYLFLSEKVIPAQKLSAE